MKPIKNFELLSAWIIRITSLLLVISLFSGAFSSFSLSNVHSVLRLIYLVSFILLLVGGFAKGNTLTIISGLLIALLSAYYVYWSFNGRFLNPDMYRYALLLGVGLLFSSRGNA